MKIQFLTLLFLINFSVFGQESQIASKILDTTEVNRIFSKTLKIELKIKHPITRVYKYEDLTGVNYLVLTQKNNKKKKEEEEILNDSIQAFNFRLTNGILKKSWSLRDFTLKNEDQNENSIFFWTKYIELKDYNSDGIIEPIIVYGASEENDLDRGRMKILIYFKDKKRAIRHQNDPLDDERKTQVDESILNLPIEIRKKIRSICLEMEENRHSHFNSFEGRFEFE